MKDNHVFGTASKSHAFFLFPFERERDTWNGSLSRSPSPALFGSGSGGGLVRKALGTGNGISYVLHSERRVGVITTKEAL